MNNLTSNTNQLLYAVTNDSILTPKTPRRCKALIDQSAGDTSMDNAWSVTLDLVPPLSFPIYINLDILCENKQERRRKVEKDIY